MAVIRTERALLVELRSTRFRAISSPATDREADAP